MVTGEPLLSCAFCRNLLLEAECITELKCTLMGAHGFLKQIGGAGDAAGADATASHWSGAVGPAQGSHPGRGWPQPGDDRGCHPLAAVGGSG